MALPAERDRAQGLPFGPKRKRDLARPCACGHTYGDHDLAWRRCRYSIDCDCRRFSLPPQDGDA